MQTEAERAEGVGRSLSAEQLRRLGEASIGSNAGMGLTDRSGRIECVNQAYLGLTGYTMSEVLGRHPVDLLRGPVADARRAGWRAALEAGEEVMAEFENETVGGRSFWCHLRMRPGTSGEGAVFYTFSLYDTTERRRATHDAEQDRERAEAFAADLHGERELLSSVLSTIPHLVFWKDTSHRYLGCNEAYARVRGLASPSEITGRSEGELAPDSFAELITEVEGQVLRTGVPVIEHSVVLEGAQNSQQVMLVSVLPRNAEGCSSDGVIGIGTDVTRITALERQLAQATRLESIGQLAAGLAHEINTPVQYVSDNVLFLADSFTDVLEALRSIANVARGAEQDPRGGQGATVADLRARLQLLVDGLDLDFLGTEIPSSLEQTLEGVARVAEIVRAMKEFSHPGQGRVETDLNRAVETTVQVSRSEWKYVAEMDLDLDAGVGLVPCYEGELKQVVLNLIVNAAHAIAETTQRAGGTELGRIGIRTRRDGDTIRLAISDNGSGMTEEVKLRIFDPFFTTKGVGKGTGQGLAMAHSCVVGKHGGSIDVDSELGVGTTFTLNLPATVDAPAGQAEAEQDLGELIGGEAR
jgi:two-component system NtrC family sensor kinase